LIDNNYNEGDIMTGNYKVIHVDDFGACPNSGEDAIPPIQRALEAASGLDEGVILKFSKGQYDLYPDKAIKQQYYITNTASETETPDVTKTIGLYIKGMNNMIIEGDDTLLMLHGKMTSMIIDQSENIEIRNLSIDFFRPTMSEMKVLKAEEDYIEFKVNEDSWYELTDGKLEWVGEGWRYTDGPSQAYDAVKDITWRTFNPVTSATRVEEIQPSILRFYYEKRPETVPGYVFQMRDGIRDQVGMLIVQSRNVTLKNVNMHYMHGLGIVGQYSENVYIDGISCVPRHETGRTNAGFADFIQMSGCRGKVTVLNSIFTGAQDDGINIHGTHLKVVNKISQNQVIVRFMHHQTYGFEAFHPGDEVEFIRPDTLTPLWSGKLVTADMMNTREILLTTDNPIPESIGVNDVVENVTWTPEVEIRGNRFTRIPTRGILVTTRRKVVIEDNEFIGLIMSAILISDDAKSWYESGMVKDVLIKRNRFTACGMPVICISPENTDVHVDNPVHSNIRIENNEFEISYNELFHKFRVADGRLLYAKSSSNLLFTNNIVKNLSGAEKKTGLSSFCLMACSDVTISENQFIGVEDSVRYTSM
jgi:hypothetical protein